MTVTEIRKIATVLARYKGRVPSYIYSHLSLEIGETIGADAYEFRKACGLENAMGPDL